MSKNAKIGIGVLVLLVILAILLTMGGPQAEAPATETDTSDQTIRDDAAAIDADDAQGFPGEAQGFDEVVRGGSSRSCDNDCVHPRASSE